ncbi:type VII secretion integral membrane protein EccD (plasmid) [Mycobacterium dioxanotrophicus]|uniref:Type VII secretion integral membrane protein EccD n=1 Tax=Mycobacterium dioxanotrophicus TaxID=482462 RepID=A0A1Y0CH20_9MYCO|nr:type VII secretion integral membrane protein EccD [Mycobacterium dioxanotrophicus]ART74354.1 type VII secretion integral membrane protein EccD [Mycobacterium dioxanotrophicus]
MSALDTLICEVQLAIGENTQVDLQLPANSKLTKVLPETKIFLSEYLDTVGAEDELPDDSRGWRLRTPLGTLLDSSKSLSELGIADGTRLELIAEPEGEAFQPRIESVSTLVSRVTAKLFPEVTPDAMSTVLLAFSAIMLATAMVFVEVIAFRSRTLPTVGAALAGVLVIAVATAANARTWHRRDVSDVCAAGLLAFGPVSLSLTLPASFGAWGAPHLVITAVATGCVAVLVGLRTGRYVPLYSAIVVVAAFVAVSQAASWSHMVPTETTTCVLVLALLVMLGRVETIAQRLGRLPVSMFPSGSGNFLGRKVGGIGSEDIEPTHQPPDPVVLLQRTVYSNDYVTGILAGLAAVATALTALIAAAHPQQWQWLLFGAGIPVVFAYRAWNFAGLRNVVVILSGAFLPAISGSVMMAYHHGLWWGVGIPVGVTVLAMLAPAVIPTESHHKSPVMRYFRVGSEFLVISLMYLAPLNLLSVMAKVYNRDFN